MSVPALTIHRAAKVASYGPLIASSPAPREALLSRCPPAVVRPAERSQVRPVQPQVRPVANRLNVVGVDRWRTAARPLADGIVGDDFGAQLAPCRIVATLCRRGPTLVEESLAVALGLLA